MCVCVAYVCVHVCMYTAKFTSALLVPVYLRALTLVHVPVVHVPVPVSFHCRWHHHQQGAGTAAAAAAPSREVISLVFAVARWERALSRRLSRGTASPWRFRRLLTRRYPTSGMNFQPFTFLLLTPGKRERKASFAPSPMPCFNVVGGGAARPLACRVTSTTGSTSRRHCFLCWLELLVLVPRSVKNRGALKRPRKSFDG